MKNSILLLNLLLMFSSCKKEKLKFYAFEVDRSIDCDDLYDNGFRRTFGVDVMMVGKKMGDTIVHYELGYPPIKYKIDYSQLKESTLVEIDTIKKVSKFDRYKEIDPLELNDSLYNLVWEKLKKQRKNVCKESTVYWRNFMKIIDSKQVYNYFERIDSLRYKITNCEEFVEREDQSKYTIYSEFNVLNLKTKDTFQCSTYKMDGRYYFSSIITVRKYD